MTPTWFDFLSIPMGKILKFFYDILHGIGIPGSYGISIILLTLMVRFLLLPLSIKQIKSTSKMAEVAPKIQEIQKKYKDNKQKQQEEMIKLYQETGYNPAGGCLPLLIQFPVIMALYYVFQNPLVYVVGKSHAYVKDLISGLTGYQITTTIIQEAQKYIDMNFFGLNLSRKETVVLPLLSAVITYFSTVYTMKSQKRFNPQQVSNPMGDQMMKSMNFVAPLMSWFIGMQVPAGLLIYWITGYAFAILQQYIINTMVYKKIAESKAKQEEDKKAQLESNEKALQEEITSEQSEENDKKNKEDEIKKKKEEERRRELEKLRQQLTKTGGKKKK